MPIQVWNTWVSSAKVWDWDWVVVCTIAIRSETSLILKCLGGKTDIKLFRKTLRKWKMVLYERHGQVLPEMYDYNACRSKELSETDKCSKFAHWISMAATTIPSVRESGIRIGQWVPRDSQTLVPSSPTSFSDVLITRVKCGGHRRWAHGYQWRQRQSVEWGLGLGMEMGIGMGMEGASPILMRFFDRPWKYAWWFLKCFNWGPKAEENSNLNLNSRQNVCFSFSRCKSGQPN